MFKNLYNIAVFEINLKPESALLIKGMDAPDPAAPDMAFIRMKTPNGDIVYIPGSSIKGVVRSFSESLLRSLKSPVPNVPDVCDASDPKAMCPVKVRDKYPEKKEIDKLPYKDHCLACRTFGSTELASRVEFSDFMPVNYREVMQSLIERPGVSIDRKKGTVKHGPFQLEVLVKGTFKGTVTFTNYQIWQIGLVLWVFDLMNEGLVKLGYAKSRGPGKVDVEINKAFIKQFGPLYNKPLSGIGQVPNSHDLDLISPENDFLQDTEEYSTQNGLWSEFKFSKETWTQIEGKIKENFSKVIGGA